MFFDRKLTKLRIKRWIRQGATIGTNFQLERGSFLDSSFPWLITIGDNVTLAPDVLVLCHDGSTKKAIGYSKVGTVVIGNNVFIGAKSIILPNTTIGSNVVIGAGSIVGGVIPSNTVVAGAPARVLQSYEEFKSKNDARMESGHTFDVSYTNRGGVTPERKDEMRRILDEETHGYIV
ncbi:MULTISPECIES: acyltransferase [Bifidobacterium]|uniref:acyltransferase n=1 Tax=Bifidobacterium TaxID=1678 RepID=UPI0019D42CC2|nr:MULTISPECIES: acyltransferase [Bifidobacterium]MBT1169953.1 acyltransferase [Bifidobacterium sp. SO4]